MGMSDHHNHDRGVIRDLARQLAEIAAKPQEQAKVSLWQDFNDLSPQRPMVLIFPEGAWREVPLKQECRQSDLQGLERHLRARIYGHAVLDDDNVVEPVHYVPIRIRGADFGLEAHRTEATSKHGAAHFEPIIKEEDDFFRLARQPEVEVDWDATHRTVERLEELFDGHLRVELSSPPVANQHALIDAFATWRGLDNLMLDMIDRPDWLHRCLQFLTDGRIRLALDLEAAGALRLNNRSHYCGSGGTGFTNELPQPDYTAPSARPRDMWGFSTTQIFSEVSPAMHEDFALRYERQFLAMFGLNAYGCCEALHHKMDHVEKIANLRRISMSPWVDVAAAAERVGGRYIFSRKPNPAMLASVTWDEDAVRRSIRDDLAASRGCVVELIMKDTHTCNGQPERLAEWVRIARQEVDAFVG
mgnify:FL=1